MRSKTRTRTPARPAATLTAKYGEPDDAHENGYKVYQWDAETPADKKAVNAAFAKVVQKAMDYALSNWREDEQPTHANYAFKCIGGEFNIEIWLRREPQKGGNHSEQVRRRRTRQRRRTKEE